MKYRILEELKSRDKEYISGEEISRRLGVSRTAVWKYINRLRQEGYNIESQTNSGYKLVQSPDTLSSFEIQPLLKTRFIGREILYFDSIDSTNSYAKKMGEENIKDGTVIIADEQTSGRGRLGRQWMSPKGKGIWMTILLKPHIAPSEASKITLAAAYALCTALDKCGLDVRIKWPNDIVVNGKKLCGILTEMSADMDIIKYIVVGIGLNANLDAHDFDSAIAATATSIKIEAGKSISRKTVELDADVIAILSNDSWFGRTPALYQHHSHAILRAVENERYVLRCSNSAISSVISPYGKVEQVAPKYELSVLNASFNTNSDRTLYSYIGDIIVMPAAALFIFSIIKKRKR